MSFEKISKKKLLFRSELPGKSRSLSNPDALPDAP